METAALNFLEHDAKPDHSTRGIDASCQQYQLAGDLRGPRLQTRDALTLAGRVREPARLLRGRMG